MYIGTQEFYKRVGIIAVPIALQSLISIGVNMMDTVMLGALGEVALSASSLANQFINIYHICCMGIGMGASVMVARFWGMHDSHSLKQSITIMLRLCIVFGPSVHDGNDFSPRGVDADLHAGPEYHRAGDTVF